jgi:hypothetical protein
MGQHEPDKQPSPATVHVLSASEEARGVNNGAGAQLTAFLVRGQHGLDILLGGTTASSILLVGQQLDAVGEGGGALDGGIAANAEVWRRLVDAIAHAGNASPIPELELGLLDGDKTGCDGLLP